LNWNDHKVKFKTDTVAINLDLKYVIPGDINRSHSSQVVVNNQIQVNSINENRIKSFAVNTTNTAVPVIDVNLNNLTVVSNTIEIPISINTNGADVGGVQFEFIFDPNKIKFEEILSSVPNTWYVFANSKSGKVKFGALDQNKNPINGTNIPFKLKFSTIGNGIDILTSVKVSPTMDASDSKGKQLGINLNTTQIKLTGYNNF
jgi:hypothetical protein